MKKVAILTNFQDFNPGYSLSGIAVDQCRMLLRKGHEVYLFVNENFNTGYNEVAGIDDLQDLYQHSFAILQKTKFMHLTDYQTAQVLSLEHRKQAEEAAEIFADFIGEHGIQVIFTHDFVYTGWNLPYALAVKRTGKKLAEKYILSAPGEDFGVMQWYHWIHSVPEPTQRKDWWDINEYGPGHFLVFPNNVELERVSQSYNTSRQRVKHIPHIKDIRSWYDFSPEAFEFTSRYPSILDAEVVQVYPCSTDRLLAKQLHLVISIFGQMKKSGAGVFLCVANQWATGRQRREDVGFYIGLADAVGLVYGHDIVFTSEISKDEYLSSEIPKCATGGDLKALLLQEGEGSGARRMRIPKDLADENLEEEKVKLIDKLHPYSKGIPKRMLRELQLISDVFIFPTREESFGLVGPEAAFSGALVIANRSLMMMADVLGTGCPSFDFGSHHNNVDAIKNPDYIKAVAFRILDKIRSNEAIAVKTYCRRRYNEDAIYRNYYSVIVG